jgi:hypothetical protein
VLIILLFDSYKCLIYSTSLKPLIYGTIFLIYMYTCYIYNACYSWLIVDKMIYYCKYNNCVVQNIDQKIHFCPKTFKDISDILWQSELYFRYIMAVGFIGWLHCSTKTVFSTFYKFQLPSQGFMYWQVEIGVDISNIFKKNILLLCNDK